MQFIATHYNLLNGPNLEPQRQHAIYYSCHKTKKKHVA